MNWRVFAAAAIGKHHLDSNLPCQDTFAFERCGEYVVAVVCDGAGSATHSDIGAASCAREVTSRLKVDLESGAVIDAERITLVVQGARSTLEDLATEKQVALRDLACTLVGAVISKSGGSLFHVGDGLGIVELDAENPVITMPENGEYANETWFVTDDDWQSHLSVMQFQGTVDCLALMSDGAMPFVMNRERTAMFGPFINPVRKYLAGVSEEEGGAGLVATLADERTWSITGDDKTLLIALTE